MSGSGNDGTSDQSSFISVAFERVSCIACLACLTCASSSLDLSTNALIWGVSPMFSSVTSVTTIIVSGNILLFAAFADATS